MKTAILAMAILAAASAAPAGAADAPPSNTVVTRLGTSTTEFSCTVSNGQDCHYLILHSLCNERFIAPGQKERTCTFIQAVPPFHIKSGERRTVDKLASDFLYTMKAGAAPTVEDVLRNPIAH